MADGMQFSTGPTAEFLAAIGQVKEAAKAVSAELKQIKQEERSLKKSGGVLSAKQQQRKADLIRHQDDLRVANRIKKEQAAIAKAQVDRLRRVQSGIYTAGRIARGGISLGDVGMIGSGLTRVGAKLTAIGAARQSALALRAGSMMATAGAGVGLLTGGAVAGAAAAGYALGSLPAVYAKMEAARRRSLAEGEAEVAERVFALQSDPRYSVNDIASIRRRIRFREQYTTRLLTESNLWESFLQGIGLPPSEDINNKATASGLRGQQHGLWLRRRGNKFRRGTSIKELMKRPEVQRALRKYDTGFTGNLRFVYRKWRDLVTGGKFSENLLREAAENFQERQEKAINAGIESLNPATANDPQVRLNFAMNQMENNIHIRAVTRDMYERDLQWNKY